MKNLKYLAIGIAVGLLIPYAIAFIKSKQNNFTSRHTYEEENEQEY